MTVHSVCIGIISCFISVPKHKDSFWQRARLLLQHLFRMAGGSMLGGIGSTIAQGRYSKLVLFRIASDINVSKLCLPPSLLCLRLGLWIQPCARLGTCAI